MVAEDVANDPGYGRLMAKLLLALDSGSQSSRALVFDSRGVVLGLGRRSHKAMGHPEQGAVEQDPADIRDCLFGAVRDCLQDWGGDSEQIVAAALTTQRATVLLADERGEPLGHAMSWLDRRTADLASEPSLLLRGLLRLLGPEALLPRLLAKSWPRIWRERQPQLLARARWLTSIEGWLHQQLLGRMVVAPSGLTGPWPFDVRTRNWSETELLYRVLGYERRWLAEIVEAGQPVGRLSARAASQTGLAAGLLFFACGGDKQAEALGAGIGGGDGDIGAVSLGTGSSISLLAPRPRSHRRYHWFTMTAAQPAVWSHEYLLFRGMWTVSWFARELARDLEPLAAESGGSVEAVLCEQAAGVPPGSDGLMLWPRWSPSLQQPNETGGWVGLVETHGRPHMFRALLEGIAFDLRRGLEILQTGLGARVRQLRLGGGGARSPLIAQIVADVLDLPVVRPDMHELAARGAAIVAAVGSGVHPSFSEAVSAMVPAKSALPPAAGAAARYERLYQQVYCPGLSRLGALSEALSKALGSD